jgi:hypothetical protein
MRLPSDKTVRSIAKDTRVHSESAQADLVLIIHQRFGKKFLLTGGHHNNARVDFTFSCLSNSSVYQRRRCNAPPLSSDRELRAVARVVFPLKRPGRLVAQG